MRYSKYSRKLKKSFDFWCNSNGGYIFLESADRTGCLGSQICDGGGFMGETLSANNEEIFEKKCDRWYRNARKNWFSEY